MLEALVRVLVWLSLGEILMHLGALPAPGPVIGLVLLYVDLTWRGHLPEALGALSDRLLGLLGPAVVLLAVPLYRQSALIGVSGGLIAAALAVGLPAGILSAVGIAWVLGASSTTLLSLAPKSVTTEIAIGVSETIGGVPALTAVLVISTGITCALVGPLIQRFLRLNDNRVTGLAMGIASHGIGTARALQISEVAGAFAGLGMSLNGVLTGVLLSIAMRFA